MKFEDLQNLWEEDSNIDRMNISTEALKIPKLHSKYYKIYVEESVRFRKMDSELKKLKIEKNEFLTLGPTEESKARGWNLPARGKILRSDIDNYLEADSDIIDYTLKVGLQRDKIKFIESILHELKQRNFHLRVALDFEKFKNGA